jgi:BA14K-like protein
MQRFFVTTLGSAALALTMNLSTPASAQVAGARAAAPLTQINGANDVTLVANKKRRGARGHRGGRHHARSHRRGRHARSHWRGRRGHWGHRRWGHDYGWGPAVGAGIAGLVLGGALAAEAQASADAIDWCDQRYRSYDRRTQTYLGYDGYRHSCP